MFSVQFSVFSRSPWIRAARGNGSTTMARKRRTGKGLAERRRRVMQLIRKRGQTPYTLYEVHARYTTSGSKSSFQWGNLVPRRRLHPGTKGGSMTLWSMDTDPN